MTSVATQGNPQPYNEIVEIIPDLAAAWLDKNENNRSINWNYVSQLARDMVSGRFACTHQGIAFDTQGRLIDGQHRLWAVLEANIPVRIRVFYNEPIDNIVHIDGNHPRRATDRMTLGHTLGTVRPDELATMRAMLGGLAMTYRRRTLHEEMDLLEIYRDAIHAAHDFLPGNRSAGICNSMVRAAIARAWYCVEDRTLLQRFGDVLRTGICAAERERPIGLLRNQLTELRRHGATKLARQRQYALASRALMAYLMNEPLVVLRPATTDLFEIPETTTAEAAA